MIQLEFFKSEEECRLDNIEVSFHKLKTSTEKVRRGVFARHNEIAKKVNDVDERLAILERYICMKDKE